MTEKRWLRIGFKFLGMYFMVLAVVAFWSEIVMIMTAPRNVVKANSVVLAGLLQPVAYLAAAAALIRWTGPIIDWCFRNDDFSEDKRDIM